MLTLAYIGPALIAFLGLIVGTILAKLSPEEMDTGKTYFPLLQKVILLSLLVFFVHALALPFLFRVPIYVFAIFYAFSMRSSIILYLFFGFVFFISSDSPTPFLTITSLIFLYGLPTGSLFTLQHTTSIVALYRKLFFHHASFLVIVALLPFTFPVIKKLF